MESSFIIIIILGENIFYNKFQITYRKEFGIRNSQQSPHHSYPHTHDAFCFDPNPVVKK
jgi:hypothetical protein